MSFYGEKFNQKDEEDIWEELKYWLENPITEQEQAARDKELNEYFNSVLAKAFED